MEGEDKIFSGKWSFAAFDRLSVLQDGYLLRMRRTGFYKFDRRRLAGWIGLDQTSGSGRDTERNRDPARGCSIRRLEAGERTLSVMWDGPQSQVN